jgi:hypothetical protein
VHAEQGAIDRLTRRGDVASDAGGAHGRTVAFAWTFLVSFPRRAVL